MERALRPQMSGMAPVLYTKTDVFERKSPLEAAAGADFDLVVELDGLIVQ